MPPDLAGFVRSGVTLYNAGRYWEAHEALESVWRAAADPGRAHWQGLIQAAAAMLHRERGNAHGLAAQGGAAVRKLRAARPAGFPVETDAFAEALERCVGGSGPVPVMELIALPERYFGMAGEGHDSV
jgi:uncharacterized protein